MPARLIVRAVLIVVGVAVSLYVIYLLRQPITWVVIATFIAVALSGPVNRLSRRIPRGLAIAVVYLGLLFVPLVLGGLVIPPLVAEVDNLIGDLPRYADELQEFVQGNQRLRDLEADYNVTQRLQEEAEKLPARAGDAAGVLSDIGFGIVNSLFALFTILILSAFLVSSGPRWVRQLIALQPADRADRLNRVLLRIAGAVGGYVAGALAVGAIAGVTTYLMLLILGVPFRAPLALLAGFASLIPLVGATLAAVLIGVVTLFTNFPTATIVWTIWAIIYQQLENNLIQPQIQKRTLNVHPFVVLVAVLFGSTLLGILGALLAIPAAASIQICIQEWWRWRHDRRMEAMVDPEAAPPTPAGGVVLPGSVPAPPGPGSAPAA